VINLRILIKLLTTILLLLLSLQTIKAQTITKLRSTLSAGGSSNTFMANGKQYYLQHSIGQSSVIGLSHRNNYLLRQGFIQPLEGYNKSIKLASLPGTVSPNPFSEKIIVSFSEEISDDLFVTFYDLNGKIIYFNKYGAAQELNLDVSSLAPAIYLIRVNTTTKCFYSKIIKL
jgi:hypothetical protein